MVNNYDYSMITSLPPKSYEWLNENDKKQFIIRSLTGGTAPEWIREEAKKYGIQMLSEFYTEAERGEHL